MQQKRIKKTGNPPSRAQSGPAYVFLLISSRLRPLACVPRPPSYVSRPPSYVPRKNSAENPAKRISAESEEIPITAQFSPQGGNGAVMGISELAAGEGFEPSHTESESAVLPLHKPAVSSSLCLTALTARHSIARLSAFVKSFFKIFRKAGAGR